MIGFLKLKAIDFDTWNNGATVKYIAETGDDSCVEYTTYKSDTDPDYVWARVEHDFIDGDILSKEDAITAGMRADDDK